MNWLVAERGHTISPRLVLVMKQLGIVNAEFVYFNFTDNFVNKGYEFRTRSNRLRSFRSILELVQFAFYVKRLQEELRIENILAAHYTIYIPLLLCGVKNVTCDANDLISTKSFLMFKSWLFFEALITRNSNVVVASRFFSKYYKTTDLRVIENMYVGDKKIIKNVDFNKRIAFVGALRHLEILTNLIVATGKSGWYLDLYGSGNIDNELKDFIEKRDYQHVNFYGRFDKSEIPSIYSNVQLLWAVYPADNWNVKFAISNKYHESISFGIPCVFSRDTLLGDMIFDEKIGFCLVDTQINTISNFLQGIDKENLDIVKRNINNYKDEYAG